LERYLSDRLPSINADAEALSSAIQNLIQNAVKYCNGERRINVATFLQNGNVAIEVADHGIGVSTAELKKIFEPFYRAKDVVDAQIHGNGLGLSLIKEIVEAHGGSIMAESEKGKGSKFTINLPVK
jgi:signal transduction histidine kinase